MLVTPILKPACSQETAVVSRLRCGGTERGLREHTQEDTVSPANLCCTQRSQFMHNKVSSSKAFLLSHHRCSFSAVFSAAGGMVGCRVSMALKRTRKNLAEGGSVGELQVGVRLFDVLVSFWYLKQ